MLSFKYQFLARLATFSALSSKSKDILLLMGYTFNTLYNGMLYAMWEEFYFGQPIVLPITKGSFE